jgi:hypothetical protein
MIECDVQDNLSSTYGKRCSKCGHVKPLSEFQKKKKEGQKTYQLSYCNKCVQAQCKGSKRRTIVSFMNDKWNYIRRRANKKSIPFGITLAELLIAYERQKGICLYTDEAMAWSIGDYNLKTSLSVDKVDPELGYTRENIVLCTRRANSIKQDMTLEEMATWTPGWYARLVRAVIVGEDLVLDGFNYRKLRYIISRTAASCVFEEAA